MASKPITEEVRRLGDMIKDIRVAMLTTVLPDGMLRSRPMATQEVEFDGDLWFFTDVESAKIHEVAANRNVNVAYADVDRNRYVSVSGEASIVRDREKASELWSAAQKAWFPNGPDDAQLVLLKVDVEHAEYWDAPSSRMVQILGFMKATLTGKRYQPGEGGKVEIDRACPFFRASIS
ncbi:MAG: pyridoxamine 5'-phosphate oxidase family protein [candidate division Zixibacteria bacterium]|nr:pyridoxamine 5'-phosphate oxidase family protein [candidate division Zixibacteria bacterium]